ncbi:hypothetical protein NUW58_g898 [Xylaria curta]|uniref:Uncharacterized protein n=1 Tax=Xylaria curta TaxID=42375 RepID=A0ACC1PQ84_9PEZI|nr:hypothetical protein NUW58_g898 [Xylaria curta]
MSRDFIGIKVLWPPDGTRPSKHEHDIVFVHGLHAGSVSDWQDENGVCWPAEHLSLDLGNVRIFAFGYDHAKLNVRSDGLYEGGTIFKPGRDLCLALMNARRADVIQARVPLTLVGHDALCTPLLDRSINVILRQTKHVVFLDTPQANLDWSSWVNIAHGSCSADSRGRWKVWSAALDSSSKAFDDIARRFDITSVITSTHDSSISPSPTVNKLTGFAHECHLVLENVNHHTISRLSRGSPNYTRFLDRIRASRSRVLHDSDEIQRLRTWLSRQCDEINYDTYQRNLHKHLPNTCRWLFEDDKFQDWARLGSSSPALWLTGPEGCGKSVLCTVAAERIKKQFHQSAVVYLMVTFDKTWSEDQLAIHLALQLLDYLIANQKDIDTEVLSIVSEDIANNRKSMKVTELIKFLVCQCPAVFVFLDGLDEADPFEEPGRRQQKNPKIDQVKQHLRSFLSFLKGFGKNKHITPLHIWCSSRRTDTISAWMQDLEAIELPEINEKGVGRQLEPDEFGLLKDMQNTVGHNFLLASMTWNRLRRTDLSITSSNKSSQSMVKHITELYQERLDQLQNIDSSPRGDRENEVLLAMKIISIVTFARQPLKLSEVQSALAVIDKRSSIIRSTPGCTDLDSNETQYVRGIEIQKLCAPFINFRPFKKEDHDGYLRLSHGSAFKFLYQLTKDRVSSDDELKISPNIMSDVCLKFLSHDRYSYDKTDFTQVCPPFFTYAAKFWHKHIDESEPIPLEAATSFMRSTHFLTMIRFQSLFLNRHFDQNLEDVDENTQYPLANVPQSFETNADLRILADDYRHFVSEWASFLQLGVTNYTMRGDIERCFWGALGGNNFLQKQGLVIEKNSSFSLYMETTIEGDDKNYSGYCYYERISDDGSRVAVWKMPAQSTDEGEVPIQDRITLVRESWYIDGHRPPLRYGPEEILNFDTKQVQWGSYDSSTDRKFPLIPILDSAARVTALNECNYGAAVRIGRSLFTRDKGSEWTANTHDNNTSYWEDITISESWIVRSCRKRLHIGIEARRASDARKPRGKPHKPIPESKGGQVSSLRVRSASSTVSSSESEVNGSGSGGESDSGSEESDSSRPPSPGYSVSSAEELCVDSPLEIDSSGWDAGSESGMSAGSDPGDEDEDEDEDDESDTASDSIASSASNPSITSEKAQTATPSEGSDTDDERSTPEGDGGPSHQFSFSRFCDLCGSYVVPSYYGQSEPGRHTFYQCRPCGRVGDSYDICSSCFDRGSWCKSTDHLLSKATFLRAGRRIFWEDGVSHHTAMPLVHIVAERRVKGQDTAENRPTSSFRYTRRHASMLHGSQPIIHPAYPLLIYPLDGRDLLLGNLKENTYSTFTVPFEASETAETSGNTCIPVSVTLRFSSCGKYVHLVRLTARNDFLLGPIRLHVLVLTIALSPTDPFSEKPQILPERQSIDLGAWPRLTAQLPCAITWTDSDVYISLSGLFLRVLRFRLLPRNATLPEAAVAEDGIYTISTEIPLPQSAEFRSVYYFPQKGKASAKIIIGSSLVGRLQPPLVVYLKEGQSCNWTRINQSRLKSAHESLQIRDDPFIEEAHGEYRNPAPRDMGDNVPLMEPLFERAVQERTETVFKRYGIFCPSCFDLGLKLNYLRPPRWVPFFFLDSWVANESRFGLKWTVKLPALVEALQAGCQFCCYVASRMLSFRHITHTSQSFLPKGSRCCAEGRFTEGKDIIQTVLNNLHKFEWKVKPEERVLHFHCEPLDQDPETGSFSKLAIGLPSITVGAKGTTVFRPTMVHLQGETESGESTAITTFIHSPETSHGKPQCILELHSLPDDPAHEFIDTRPLATSHGTDENLEVVKAWLEDCQANHPFCRRYINTEVQLPTRVIEIIDAKTVRLSETAGKIGQWLEPTGLPRQDLPAAIRDAVTISEQLGVKYIWVDAICMVQDDPEDRNKELRNMSQYYRGSFLTIAASTPRCTTGFIRSLGRCEKHPDFPVPRDLVPLDIVALSKDSDKGKKGRLYVREENPYQISQEPINKRAWTLQEGILAPRVLLFGSRVIWFCQHMTRSDGGIQDLSFDENEFDRTRRELHIELSKLDIGGLGDDRQSDEPGADTRLKIHNLWHRIVGGYSRRLLSRPEDKLPALSAVAGEFRKFANDNYLAGLWRSNLPQDLLWTTPDPGIHRPDLWRAPTWSWASVDDAILYDQLPPTDATLLAEIVQAEVIPMTTTVPFGEVIQGHLEITAPTFSTERLTEQEDRDKVLAPFLRSFGYQAPASTREMLHEGLKSHARPSWKKSDEDEDKFHLPEQLKAIILFAKPAELVDPDDAAAETETTSKRKRWIVWGLLLKPAEGACDEPVYERVLAFSNVGLTVEDALPPLDTFRVI